MRKSHDLTIARLWQTPISVLCLAVPIIGIRLACNEQHVSAFLPLAVYCLYTAGAAALLTMIALRLYTMHGVRRFVYDIAIWFMGAALVALPLGAANIFANWIAEVEANLDARAIQTMRLTLAACFYFELIPVFFLTEAIMSLATLVVRKLRVRKITTGG